MSSGTPGFSGIVGIASGVIVVGVIMSIVTGMWSQWPPLIAALLVSFLAMQSIRK